MAVSSDTPNPALFSAITLSDSEYEAIRELVYRSFGINLTNEKRSLVVGRLQKHLRSKGFQSFGEYYEYVSRDTSKKALLELADRISTNHTFFYREQAHFELFTSRVLPEISSSLKIINSRDLRIWSAGCSSGEEPYTLVMLMMEYFGTDHQLWDAGVLATDISERMLDTARKGIYPYNATYGPAFL